MTATEDVRGDLAHYMKTELGMKVDVHDNKKKSVKQKSDHPQPSKNHAQRQRERQRKAKAEKKKQQMIQASAAAAPAPSTNRNTLKNKRRRQLKKQFQLKQQQEQQAATSSTAITTSVNSTDHTDNNKAAEAPSIATQQTASRFKALSRAFDQGEKWFNQPDAKHTLDIKHKLTQTIIVNKAAEERIAQHKAKAESLLAAFAASIQSASSSSALSSQDSRWLANILHSGTLTDKIAGMQLLMQDRCIGRLEVLQKLLSMAQKKGRRESLLAMDALRDLFIQDLLPSHRTLLFFTQQPYFHQPAHTLNNAATIPPDTTLMYWFFEDQLKHIYTSYLSLCEEHLHDTMSYIKKHAINTLYSLLLSLPEREQTILSLLINKLGDPDKKIASRIVYLCTELIYPHPAMKLPIVKEVANLLYRPGLTERAQYYAIIYLNQMRFHSQDSQDTLLAKKMIDVYFTVFHKETLKAKEKGYGSMNSKMLGALLTGLNRAVPYARTSTGSEGEQQPATEDVMLSADQYDILFTLVHTSTFNTAVQALLLLYQFIVHDATSALATRFYRALYALLHSPALLHTSSRLALFLNLLYKALKHDTIERRVCAMLKRMLQVCLSAPAPFVCGCLYLCSEVMQQQAVVKLMMIQGEARLEDEQEQFTDVKEDKVDSAIQATIKEEEEINGGHENELAERQLKEEDVDDDEDQADAGVQNGSDHKARKSLLNEAQRKFLYDPNKRDPLYANAQNSCFWELTCLCGHYHPSVISWSRTLLCGMAIHYDGDPLTDFTNSAFLDRFVFKNPKKISTTPTTPHQQHQLHLTRTPSARDINAIQMSSAAFLQKQPTDIHEDEMFYYQYFRQKQRRDMQEDGDKQKKKKKKEKVIAGKGGDEEAAMDEFADRLMEAELLKSTGAEDEAEDEELLEALDEEQELEEEEEALSTEQLDDDEEEEASVDLSDEAELGEYHVPSFSDEDADLSVEEEEDEDTDEDDNAMIDGALTGKARRTRGSSVTDAVAGLGSSSVFASADEFAELLSESPDADIHPKAAEREEAQREWVNYGGRRSSQQQQRRKRGKRKAARTTKGQPAKKRR